MRPCLKKTKIQNKILLVICTYPFLTSGRSAVFYPSAPLGNDYGCLLSYPTCLLSPLSLPSFCAIIHFLHLYLCTCLFPSSDSGLLFPTGCSAPICPGCGQEYSQPHSHAAVGHQHAAASQVGYGKLKRGCGWRVGRREG